MNVSTEQLLQIIGELHVREWALNKQIDIQSGAIRQHMTEEHSAPEQEPEPQAEAEE